MRSRLVAAVLGVAVVVILSIAVPLGVVGARLVWADERAQLQIEADALVVAIQQFELRFGRAISVEEVADLLGDDRQLEVVDHQGDELVVGRLPEGRTISARAVSGRDVSIVLRVSAADAAARARRVWVVVSAVSAVVAVGAAVTAMALAQRLTRPLADLAATSARLGAGDFTARTQRHGVPEIDAVGAALDHSADRLAALLARERAFSANASHQLRTALTGLRLPLEALASGAVPADDVEVEAAAALAGADRLEHMVEELLALAQEGRTGEARPTDVRRAVTERARFWSPTFEASARSISVEADPLVARVSPGALAQALDALLDNALRHGAGEVAITVSARGDGVAVRVADEGPGVPDHEADAIFERGRSLDGGSGLGLAVARDLIEGDGGRVVLAGVRPAAFEVWMPAAEGGAGPSRFTQP